MKRSVGLLLGVVLLTSLWGLGCGKKVNPEKTLDCAMNQPYKNEADCKKCCGGDYKLSDEVCLCYK